MKTFLATVGGVLAVLFVVGAACIGFIAYNGHKLDMESKVYADTAVTAIADDWSAKELTERAAPDLRNDPSFSRMSGTFTALSRLGHMTHYDGATGQSFMSFVIGKEHSTTATYVAKAEFENGSATIKLALIKSNDGWQVRGFHVDPVLTRAPREPT